ncbi:hypothetical protein C8Q78DRAFT_975449 [Trametes maxima]|nr:hypothetical protein C8Q78DRAFT_975449 [Trametes maxima]
MDLVDDGTDHTLPTRKRGRELRNDQERLRHWYPWYDKITCTLDVLMHLPRSVFSQRQLDLFLWLLKVNDVEDVPSVRSMLRLNSAIQRACGIDSIAYKGVLGHTYYVNALDQIIAQEMANPRVRPYLHFYPEDTHGRNLSEARQAEQWLKKTRHDLLTPMLCCRDQDYYVHEPAMLQNGEVCMPVRWYTCVESGAHVWYAKCWEMRKIETDVVSGWRVFEHEDYVVKADHLLKAFPKLKLDAVLYGLPDPTRILGHSLWYVHIDFVGISAKEASPWMFTEPSEGNQWRKRGKGHRVLAFPLWMYCDDTSGNLSKKWNEHNSVLMTPAGLPHDHSSKEYNIHFLCTSNIAPPLEMMDGVVQQLEEAQAEGIWAWDCVQNEPVLVIPFVLALLGDNPMQSEFACHMGLQAKFFCRNCWCKGQDVAGQAGDGSEVLDELIDKSQSDVESTDGQMASGRTKRRKKVLESMSDMVTRVTNFLKPGRKRTKAETEKTLRSYFTMAATPHTKTEIAKERTRTGIKDTFQLTLLEKLFDSYKSKRGYEAKQNALNEAIEQLPEHRINPVWRIKGLDAHQDTPVEILHVVLLGFVKYFWRDLVQGQLKNKDKEKELLITRLSSLDVSGLGLSPLAGRTLVQYAGSLTGRDFRAISQVAPFVIYDMVSPECYEAWASLSRLVPLIWQPVIEDVKDHLKTLDEAIKNFLLCTAQWNVRWFNKPKFHIIIHLVDHICRFGPASLFATEAFESFNAVIRAKSVHSNRQAPSRDIARSFAQGNRIRHLLSGGYFRSLPVTTPDPEASGDTDLDGTSTAVQRTPFSFVPSEWTTVGHGPRSLVSHPNTISDYLGLAQKSQMPTALAQHYSGMLFQTGNEVLLQNGDRCRPGDHIIFKHPGTFGQTSVGRVQEIITSVQSPNFLQNQADIVLVETTDITNIGVPYRMPRIVRTGVWHLLSAETILCNVNAQHHCAAHGCEASGSRNVRQERELTTQTVARVQHIQPNDLILNIAQMRDSHHLQKFRVESEAMDVEKTILAAVAREIDAQKTARSNEEAPGTASAVAAAIRGQERRRGGRGRGRGRGRGENGGGRGGRGGRGV